MKGRESFTDKEMESFKTKVERFLKKGNKENKKSKNKYAASYEKLFWTGLRNIRRIISDG